MTIKFENTFGTGAIYMDCLRAICGETKGKSMIDLGCCYGPHTCQLGFEKRTYVDIIERKLDDENEQQYFVKEDVLYFLANTKERYLYDVTIASDFIEHLTEEDGISLLGLMDINSNRQVLFTPLGEYMVDKNDVHPENHHSGWTPDKLESIIPNHYAYIVFPKYHELLNAGGIFFWHCNDMENDFKRVIKELNTKEWVKNSQVHYS